MIGPNNDEESLHDWITYQVCYFPNEKKVNEWIITAADSIDKVIIENKILVNDMTLFQLSNVFIN